MLKKSTHYRDHEHAQPCVKHPILGRKSKEYFQAYLMLAPLLIGFILFTIYPIGWLVRFSVYDYNGFSAEKFSGTYNFVRAFTREPGYWLALQNTAGADRFIEQPARDYDCRIYTSSNPDIKIRMLCGDDGIIVCAFNYCAEPATAKLELYDIQAAIDDLVNLSTKAAQRVEVHDHVLAFSIAINGSDVALWKISL